MTLSVPVRNPLDASGDSDPPLRHQTGDAPPPVTSGAAHH